MLSDTIIVDGQARTVTLIGAQCCRVGAKKLLPDGSPMMTKAQGCLNTPENVRPIIFSPVYECSLFGQCAPFEKVIEDSADSTQPCGNCDKFTRSQSGNWPDQPPTMEG